MYGEAEETASTTNCTRSSSERSARKENGINLEQSVRRRKRTRRGKNYRRERERDSEREKQRMEVLCVIIVS